jgi:hypothetical protein
MAREWKSRPAPEPTTLHEICRRYVATAATLAKVMGANRVTTSWLIVRFGEMGP